MVLETITLLFTKYSILLSFLGGLIGGEEIIMTLSFFSAAEELLPLWHIMVFASIGVFISDIIVFSIGRMETMKNFKKLESFSKVYKKIDRVITRLSKKRVFLTLLYTKFMYGARVLTLLYLGMGKTNYKRFLIADFLVVAIWIIPVTMVGWLGGSGYRWVMTLFKSIEIAAFLIVLFIIILIFLRKWIRKALIGLQGRLS